MKIAPIALLALTFAAHAETTVTIDRNSGTAATPKFQFARVPPPSADDAATGANVTLIAGKIDDRSPKVTALVDGAAPSSPDQPESNVYFKSNSWGARVTFDLHGRIDIAQINSYSWHPDTRAPQVYKVYAANGDEPGIDLAPSTKLDPARAGWKFIAFVDTRTQEKMEGGQYGVSIGSTTGTLGRYRYLLFDFFETESEDPWGQTFYSEVDVVAAKSFNIQH